MNFKLEFLQELAINIDIANQILNDYVQENNTLNNINYKQEEVFLNTPVLNLERACSTTDDVINLVDPELKLNEFFQEFPFVQYISWENENNFTFQADNINQVGSGINFRITSLDQSINTKFQCMQLLYELSFSDADRTFAESTNDLENLFKDLHSKFTQNLDERDQIRMVFFHDSLNQPISLPFMESSELTPNLIMTKFENVVQSYKNVTVDYNNSFMAIVQIAKIYSGGNNKRKLNNENEANKKSKLSIYENKNSIKKVYNNDNLCALRAILIAKAYLEKDPNRYKFTNSLSCNLFESIVNKIANELRFDLSQKLTINEIIRIEMYLQDYQITVIDSNGKLNKTPIYVGPINKKFLYISLENSHFNVITSMKAYLNVSYYCDYCKVGYDHLRAHKCEAQCKCCRKYNCYDLKSGNESKYYCKTCKVQAKSFECWKLHKDLICNKVNICSTCNKFKKKNHICGNDAKYCKNCKSDVGLDHQCFIKADQISEKKFNGYIFFDYEAMVNKRIHDANLIIAKQVCSSCLDEADANCNDCCKKIFYTNDAFCEWLFTQTDYIALAHNLKGYDGIFIVNYILRAFLSIDSMPTFLFNGTKVLSIQFRNVKVIDSYSFLPMGLDKFSKTFNIAEHKKGFFPHLFNTAENKNYVGKYPAKEYYSPQFFSVPKYQEFEIWYSKNCDNIFHFNKEFMDYCESDVELLANGCLAFRKIIMSQTKSTTFPNGIDPYQKTITIASLCHFIFRNNLMIPETIAVIPKLGYNPEQRTSVKCQIWLRYLAEKNSIYIQHARNEGEFKIKEYLVDGYCSDTNTIYEFHGCVYHGCPKCFTPETFNSIKQQTMGYIYRQHCQRMEKIKFTFMGSLFSK